MLHPISGLPHSNVPSLAAWLSICCMRSACNRLVVNILVDTYRFLSRREYSNSSTNSGFPVIVSSSYFILFHFTFVNCGMGITKLEKKGLPKPNEFLNGAAICKLIDK